MTTTAAQKMEQAKLALARNPATAAQIDAIYKFLLSGEGGGTWIVSLKEEANIHEGDGNAECTIRMAASDYVDLLEGRAEAQELFFDGKLEIDGDINLALKLGNLNEILT
jgi:putative sterol carrier protein